MSRLVLRHATASALVAGLVAAIPTGAVAAPDGSDLVINEIYAHGGSSGASYRNKYVELVNPTAAPIDVSGWSVQYRSATGVGSFSGVIALGDHRIPPGSTFLVGGASNNAATDPGADLPDPDAANPGVSFAGASGTIALVRSTTALTGDPATVLASPDLVDLVGYGSSNTVEGAAAAGLGLTVALHRTDGVDTDVNAADFAPGDPSPTPCGEECDVEDSTDPAPVEPVSIAQIQGTGAVSPVLGRTVTTTGVVTGDYDTGGFNGVYLQTPGTGGPLSDDHGASHGLYVYGSAFARAVEPGDLVTVTGPVAEYRGLTQIELPTAWEILDTGVQVEPTPIAFPLGEEQREALEGMLVDATAGTFTVTNNYATNTYADLGLAAGDTVLPQPTNVVRPRTAAYDRLVAENAARLITLDDGRSINYAAGADRELPVPWLTADNEVRTGASVTIDEPLILDYRNDLWKLQPREPIAAGDEPATVSAASTREPAPADVGGSIRLASFNVLNYFTTTGEDWVSSGRGACTWYTSRTGEPITVNQCTNDGPRGAATDASRARQEAKIVRAINTLDAHVLSLEEIEDTGTLGGDDRDEALDTLVAALNEDAGEAKWAAVASPETIPSVGRDVIRTAFVYQPAVVEPVGESIILDSPAFANARAPLAQEFRPVDGDAGQDFLAIVNHFKSKGSGSGSDADQGDGQGASNRSRIAQAEALVDFVADLERRADTDRVFLLGDFNSYAKEDPLQIIEDAGFVNVDQRLTDEETYQFDGLHGSFDHVFASAAAFAGVTGADVWTINAPESIGREYSRYDNNVTPLFDPDSPYRASDHDPVLVGYDPGAPAPMATTTSVRAPAKVWAHEAFDVAVTVTAETGSPRGTAQLTVDGSVVASGPVTDGAATLTVEPDALAPGRRTLDVVFAGEGRYRDSAARATVDVRAESRLAAAVGRGTYGRPTAVTVTNAAGGHGLVVAVDPAGRVLAGGLMVGGRATVRIPGTALRPGVSRLTIAYGGGGGVEPADIELAIRIAKAKPTLATTVLTAKVTERRRAKVRITVRTPGFTEQAGRVRILRGTRQIGVARVKKGRAVVRLKPIRATGRIRLKARYTGSPTTASTTRTFTIRVR